MSRFCWAEICETSEGYTCLQRSWHLTKTLISKGGAIMWKQRILWIVFFLMSVGFSWPNVSFSAPEQRLALLIGNGNYNRGGRLANPVNDVRAMKTALEGLGFAVFKYENCSQRDMKEAMDEFGSKLKGQDVGLFFYAGHGVQVHGYNYLIPVDANLSNEKKVEYDCVRADRVLADMEHAGVRTSVVILDACRDNPFERSWQRGKEGSGLAFMNAPSGSLIAYSTAPGKTALDGSTGNSPYTAALLEHIGSPNITVLQMFQRVRSSVAQASHDKQIPWESTSLKGDFYFAALGKTPGPVKVEKVPLPSGEGVSFDDILKAEQEKKQAMERWSAWQAAKEKEYAQVQEIDRSDYLTPEQKKAAWERFLSTVADNNPFSEKDEELRGKAEERLRYWKGYKVASVPSTPKRPVSSSSGSNLTDRDGVYAAYANGVVRDTSTGLEWKAGPDKNMNWNEARSWVESLGSDWRMPTTDELKTLYKEGKGDRNMTSLLKTTAWFVWSGEQEGPSDARNFNFGRGDWLWDNCAFSNSLRAFAVRSRSDG